MIDGVKIKPIVLHYDARGFLHEILRSDEPFFKNFGQVYLTCCKYGIAKGWHHHKLQEDNFVAMHGKALIVLYDAREGSPTHDQVNEFVLTAPPMEKPDYEKIPECERPSVLKIPKGVVHGFTSLSEPETRILNVPDRPYNRKEPDEYRMPWDTPDIPYKWPKHVKEGG